jgi:D-serine deaminase-like pyridoxal phosphate-dependent protein
MTQVAEPQTTPPIAPRLPPDLDTPCLVIDLDIVESNARRMAEALATRGIALRPHVKTHKSVALARIQIESGARGITVGTLGEAEAMAQGGIDDIFLAYPIWLDAQKAARLNALLEREGLRFTVGVDSVAGAQQLAGALNDLKRVRVLVEIDPSYHRTGVGPQDAAEVAAAARSAGLEVIGAFTHGGHAYAGREMVGDAAADEVEALARAADSLRSAGFEPQVLSAGSTPTALRATAEPVNELRPGTYLINDRIQVHMGSSPVDGVAIAIAATVVSTAAAGKFVINAGAKSLTKDMPPYLRGFGFLPQYPDGVLERVSDYHGEVWMPDGAQMPSLGDVVAVVPNHACPTIDLFDTFIATRGGRFVSRMPVDARGRSG